MEKHKAFQLICTLIIVVGVIALLLGAVRFVADIAASAPIGEGAAVLAFALMCLFSGFAGRVLTDIEISTRK
ncbi:MAG TPA: hypothetical protein VIX17_07125 [Pyrinomonadaceae bacterium]|jgi:hypothetical protein